MASKVAAAKIAAWSGVRTVIAAADRPDVLLDALAGSRRRRHRGPAPDRRLGARKLWIAFAVGSSGTVVVDEGARRALLERGISLLPAGVPGVAAATSPPTRRSRSPARRRVIRQGPDPHRRQRQLRNVAGGARPICPTGVPNVVVHRDDLVVVPGLNRTRRNT